MAADFSGKRNPLTILVGVFWVVGMLAGCAIPDKNECVHADWKNIGFEDGARGYPGARIGNHRKACAKYGVAPDPAQYEAGRRMGLEQWCLPRNGYRLGTQGKIYNGVCPRTLEPAFVEAINQGRALLAYENEVRKQNLQLKQTHAELDALGQDIKSMAAEMASAGVSPRRRLKLLKEMRKLEAAQRQFADDIADMEQTLEDMRANLERIRAENPFR